MDYIGLIYIIQYRTITCALKSNLCFDFMIPSGVIAESMADN